jgi:hypothetical protein
VQHEGVDRISGADLPIWWESGTPAAAVFLAPEAADMLTGASQHERKLSVAKRLGHRRRPLPSVVTMVEAAFVAHPLWKRHAISMPSASFRSCPGRYDAEE